MYRFCLQIALLASLAAFSVACTCAKVTFEQQYCHFTDVSVKAKVVAVADNCPGKCDPITDQFQGRITYVAVAERTFKGKAPEDGLMLLDTRVNGGLCGVVLQVGTTYLFNLREGKTSGCPGTSYDVNLCSNPVPFNSLSVAEQKFLLRNAATNQSECKDIENPFP